MLSLSLFQGIQLGDAISLTAGLDGLSPGAYSDTSAARGSLTNCIENNEIANEIEISESSIKRVMLRVSGLSSILEVAHEDDSGYCAMSLV